MTWSSRARPVSFALATVAVLGTVSAVGTALGQRVPVAEPALPVPPGGLVFRVDRVAPPASRAARLRASDSDAPQGRRPRRGTGAAWDNTLVARKTGLPLVCKTLQRALWIRAMFSLLPRW
jgi:hypothetical protein